MLAPLRMSADDIHHQLNSLPNPSLTTAENAKLADLLTKFSDILASLSYTTCSMRKLHWRCSPYYAKSMSSLEFPKEINSSSAGVDPELDFWGCIVQNWTLGGMLLFSYENFLKHHYFL